MPRISASYSDLSAASLLACLVAHAAPVPAQTVDVIYGNALGAPSSNLPGYPGETFLDGGFGVFRDLQERAGHWSFVGYTQVSGQQESRPSLLVDDVVVLHGGDPAPWAGPGAILIEIGDHGLNASGHWAAVATTSSANVQKRWIVSGGAGPVTVIAAEGDPIAALAGAHISAQLGGVAITDDGRVGYLVGDAFGTPLDAKHVLVLDGVVVLQGDVTVPSGPSGGATLQLPEPESGWATGALPDMTLRAVLNSSWPTDGVALRNGTIVLREGMLAEGTGYVAPIAANGLDAVRAHWSGSWLARGANQPLGGPSNAFDRGWVLHDGGVVAETGDGVPGTTEVWSFQGHAFDTAVANSRGDSLVGGFTNGGPLNDRAFVFNGVSTVLHRGDPIDYDGNGLFDEGMYVSETIPDSAFLDDQRRAWILVRIFPTTTGGHAEAILRIDPTTIGASHCTSTPNTSGQAATIVATGSASVSAELLALSAGPCPRSVPGLFLYGSQAIQVPFGAGVLCVGGGVSRLPGITSTNAGALIQALDLDAPPVSGAFTPGQTWHFQAWFRDPVQSFNLSDAVSVTFVP